MNHASPVAPPEDILYHPSHDMLDDKVYERKKREAKDRVCFANHYAPRCATFTYAQAQYQQRSMQSPYGDPDKKGPLRESVVTDSKLAARVAALCKIHHQVGDAFSIEHVWPTPMLQFESYLELTNMPGVFVFTWDNCQFDEPYRHTQVSIMNQPHLAVLARDCDNTPTKRTHDHLTIGFDKDIKTEDVAAYSWGWCREYSKAFRDLSLRLMRTCACTASRRRLMPLRIPGARRCVAVQRSSVLTTWSIIWT